MTPEQLTKIEAAVRRAGDVAHGLRGLLNLVATLTLIAMGVAVVTLNPPHCEDFPPVRVMPAESVSGLAYCGVEGRISRMGYVFAPEGVYPASRCTQNKAEIPALQAKFDAGRHVCTSKWELSPALHNIITRIPL